MKLFLDPKVKEPLPHAYLVLRMSEARHLRDALEALIHDPGVNDHWHIDDDGTHQELLTVWINDAEAGD